MDFHPAGSRPTKRANADYFTGTVWMDPIVEAKEPARLRAVRVSFEPGARTAWHAHSLGQTLYVTAGTGWIQMRGGPKREIRPGDTVWIPPAVIHWHGATATTAMTHIAMQEALDGKTTDWMEKVTDGEYGESKTA
jgi:quercetin dioxygenase-like cupin family protein